MQSIEKEAAIAQDYLSKISVEAEALFDKFLPPVTDQPCRLHEAMRYSMLAGGKRLRPALVRATFDMFGGKGESVELAMVALEMIHTFSLIHDDLPCIDNDDFRRGKPTSHKQFGEATAVMAGDALCVLAFELMGKTGNARAIEVLAHLLSTYGLIGGEMIDIECEGKEVDLETVDYIHYHKTAALIEAALQVGAMLAGASTNFEQSSSSGSFTIKLKNWSERKGEGQDVNSIMEEIYRRTEDIANAKIQVNTGAMIPGYGRTNNLEIHLQDKQGGTIADLERYTKLFIDSLNKREEISRAYTNFDTKYPQYRVEVDAALCKRNGVSPSDVLKTLSIYVGGSYASNLNRFTKLYRVMVQASPEFRADVASLNNYFVRTSKGEMSPIGQYVKLTRIYGSETLSRFNLFPSIQIGGVPADGYSAGQAINAVSEVAAGVLPDGYGYEFGGMTREEASASNMTAFVFVICIIFIYLILCALYESLFVPLAVILAVPFGLCGSFIFAKIWGLENNIYMQTGLIMLIGLLSKTAILLTEYASARRRAGMGIGEAALDAARVRLRPILMTSMTMIFGLLPMALSTGVGANGNCSLGVGTIGGMLIGTIALLLIVPVLFIIFQTIEEKVLPKRKVTYEE